MRRIMQNEFLPKKAQDILKAAYDQSKDCESLKEREQILNKAITAVKMLYPKRFK